MLLHYSDNTAESRVRNALTKHVLQHGFGEENKNYGPAHPTTNRYLSMPPVVHHSFTREYAIQIREHSMEIFPTYSARDAEYASRGAALDVLWWIQCSMLGNRTAFCEQAWVTTEMRGLGYRTFYTSEPEFARLGQVSREFIAEFIASNSFEPNGFTSYALAQILYEAMNAANQDACYEAQNNGEHSGPTMETGQGYDFPSDAVDAARGRIGRVEVCYTPHGLPTNDTGGYTMNMQDQNAPHFGFCTTGVCGHEECPLRSDSGQWTMEKDYQRCGLQNT